MSIESVPAVSTVVERLHDDIRFIVGLCDLLLDNFSDADPRRTDIVELQRAASHALALIVASTLP